MIIDLLLLDTSFIFEMASRCIGILVNSMVPAWLAGFDSDSTVATAFFIAWAIGMALAYKS